MKRTRLSHRTDSLGTQDFSLGGESEDSPDNGLNTLELRDVVLSDLVRPSVVLSLQSSSESGGTRSPPACKSRSGKDASLMTIPIGLKSTNGVELLEQMSHFEPGTRQRLLLFGAPMLHQAMFECNRHVWVGHSDTLGVLIHLHDAHELHSSKKTQPESKISAPTKSETGKSLPSFLKSREDGGLDLRKKVHGRFFLQNGDYDPESVKAVNFRRQEQCSFFGSKFSPLHCESFVEILHGAFSFDERLPPLSLVSHITDVAVEQHLDSKPVFKIPLTIRLSCKGRWKYIRCRDHNKRQVELQGNQLRLFVGLWLSLQRLWSVQHSTSHPHRNSTPSSLPGDCVQEESKKMHAPPPFKVQTQMLQSRSEMSILRQEFFFVLTPMKHLWARYLCELTAFIKSFSNRFKVWVDCKQEALCVSVVVPEKSST